MGILYIKALHIVFVVSWFAGLLYIVRLFIYHTEAEVKPEPQRSALQDQFKIMEKRLWYGITWPAAILATIFGYWLVIKFNYWSQPWMMVKLTLTTMLLVYQVITHFHFLKLQKGIIGWSSLQLRVWNEVATLLLVAIVFVVVLKNSMDWLYGVLGFLLFGVMLMLAIRIYKRLRK